MNSTDERMSCANAKVNPYIISRDSTRQLPSSQSTYELRVLICPEDDGRFSAIAIRLPGVASHGDSIEEALENIKEAFRGAAEYYLESGEIPWEDSHFEWPSGAEQRWILVDA